MRQNPVLTKSLQAAFLLLLGLWVFSPALRGGWLFDDKEAVLNNPVLHGSAGLWRIWFAPRGPDYFPLKDTVQWLQWHFFGINTTGYHLTNLALHLTSALLVWLVLARLGVGWAWLGGLLFAVHPVTVESVAWISELKNTLSLPFLLLALLAYLHYDRCGDRISYVRSVAAFLAALLSKTSGIMFPVLLLLYGWWRYGRIRREDWKRSLIFFAIALVLGGVTMSFQHAVIANSEAMDSPDPLSRLLCAGLMLAFYLAKCFWPVGLDIIYFRWNIAAATPWEIFSWFLIVAALVALAFRRKPWTRNALFGFLFFLINLVPVLGFAGMAWLRYAWVADHFVYLPLIGLVGLAAAGAGHLDERFAGARSFLVVAAAAVVALLAWQAHAYARVFGNSVALWTHNVRDNPASWFGYNNLGVALIDQGRPVEAIGQFSRSLQVRPGQAAVYVNWGNALMQLGRVPDAIDVYRAALALHANDAPAHNQLGNALFQNGQFDEAIGQYRLALENNPDYVEAHSNLEVVFTQMGRWPEAMDEGRTAIRIDPDNAHAHYNLGIVLGETGQMSAAADEFARAARLDPDDPEALYNLGIALEQEGQFSQARQQFQKALRINPHYEAARRAIDRLPDQER